MCLKNVEVRQLKVYKVLKFGCYIDNENQPAVFCVCQRMEGLIAKLISLMISMMFQVV